MYILHDILTGEYLTEGGWVTLPVSDDMPLHGDVMLYPTLEDARSGLEDVLLAWDKRYPVPSETEYEFLEVRSAGWVLAK